MSVAARLGAGAVAALLLAGCLHHPPGGVSGGGDDACGAGSRAYLIGQDDRVLAGLTLPSLTRILYPDTPRTEDYSPQRLNIEIDANGIIFAVTCG